jgi:hypothetical protein
MRKGGGHEDFQVFDGGSCRGVDHCWNGGENMKRVKTILILVMAMASFFCISSSVVQAQQVTPSQPPIIKEDKPIL